MSKTALKTYLVALAAVAVSLGVEIAMHGVAFAGHRG